MGLLKFAKDKRRGLEWLFEAKKRYGLTILNYMVTSNQGVCMLNITRYIDTFEEKGEIDVESNLKELAEADAELVKLEMEMAGHLKKTGIVK